MATIRLNKQDKTIKVVHRPETIRLSQPSKSITLKHTGKTGPQGEQGPQGVTGPQGPQGIQGEQGLTGPQGATGPAGADGTEIELQNTGTHVQWRYVDGSWVNLIALTDITGADGAAGEDGTEIELQVNATHIQWRYVGGAWTDLIALSTITGPQGPQGPQGIQGEQGPQGDPGTGASDWGDLGGTLSNQTDLQNALDAKLDITDQTHASYIYNSSATQTGNVYNDWQDLIDKINADGNPITTINFQQNETLPAGTYNLDNVKWLGNSPASLGGTVITLPDGFVASSWARGSITTLAVVSNSSTPIVTSSGIFFFNILAGSAIACTDAPFFALSVVAVIFLESSSIGIDGFPFGTQTPCISVSGSGSFIVINSTGANSYVYEDQIIGTEGTVILNLSSTAAASTYKTWINNQPSFSGTANISYQNHAKFMRFSDSIASLGVDNVQEAIEALAALVTGGTSDPTQGLNVLIGLEDRAKYALLGGGKFSSYDSQGFKVANPGNLADGGFDIYNEYVPLWQGASSDNEQWTFQEIFTIEEDLAWGGDLVETAICWKGSVPVPFVELTAADSATVNASGNGYGEYPSKIYSDNQYNGSMFMLQRVRYTYNPSTGQVLMYRPIFPYETPDSTAFGIDWKIADTENHVSPGSHPIDDVDPTVFLKIGKGSGRYLVSRVTVNAFDGTPYCDFNPVANTVDENTVYDPVLDDNWVNTDSDVARIIEIEPVVNNWFNDEAIAGRNAHFVGTWSAVSLGVNGLDGSYISLLADYVPTEGDIIRVRTAGTTDIGNGSETFAVNDLIWWDGTVWRRIYNTDPSTKANASHTHAISDVTDLSTQLGAKAADSDVVKLTGNQTVGGAKTFSSDVTVPDEAYDATNWNGSLEVPTKNAIRDKIESLVLGGGGTNGFEYQNYENTGTYVYVGYEHTDGNWYIYRRTIANNDRLYTSGASSYATNWTNRASLSYA